MNPTTANLRRLCIFTILLTAIHLSGATESNAWNGTWKLNEAKSQFTGPTFTMTISGDGEFQINSATYRYTFYCDGRYRPVIGPRTLACLKVDKGTMDLAEKDNGRLVRTVHRELSPDGKTLTQTTITVKQNAKNESAQRVFIRTDKSYGFSGAWRDLHALEHQAQVMVTEVRASTFRLSFPMEKQYADMNLDGTDAPVHIPFSGVNATQSVKQESSQRLLTIEKLNGTVVNEGVLILSSDGRTLTQETWKPGNPKEKTRLVYEKQ